MLKKLGHIFTIALFFSLGFWSSLCYADGCVCNCYESADGGLIYTFPDNSLSDDGCSDRCYNDGYSDYSCCDWGYQPYTCPGSSSSVKGKKSEVTKFKSLKKHPTGQKEKGVPRK